MPTNLFPSAYDRLVDEDIEWLLQNTPDSLERDHIITALQFGKREYRLRGYDEAMNRTGPHYPTKEAETDFPLGRACDLSKEGGCESCQ